MRSRDDIIKALQLEIEYPYSWDCSKECPYYGQTDEKLYEVPEHDV